MRTLGSCFSASLTALLLAGGFLPAADGPSNAKYGSKVEHVTFKDAAGKSVSLAELGKDKKAVVVVFLSFECPVSSSYAQTLTDMAKTYADRVAVIGVINDDTDAAGIAKQVREYKISFPVFQDDKHAVADAFKAETTPEAFLLDAHAVVRYRGRIDNGYSARLKKNAQITRHDLKQALNELLADKPVSEPVTQAIGCAIVRESAAGATGKVTYHRDVLPILQKNCQGCHRPGEVGPFSLLTYKQAVRWSGDIKDYTQTHRMPPWKPVDGPAFRDERQMSDRDIATLAAWVENGTPEGNPKDAPAAREFVEGWMLGKPDLVLTMDSEYQLGPSGRDIFRCMVLPTKLPEDKFVTAVEFKPGNSRILHHTLTFIDTTGAARDLEKKEKDRARNEGELDVGPGYSAGMGGVGFRPAGGLPGWAPGQLPRHTPAGTGFLLPKGSDVVLQMHYHRDGRIEKDRTSIGLYFAQKPVQKRFQSLVIPGGGSLPFLLNIPPNNGNYRVHGTVWVGQDCTLYHVMPHMHLIGKKIKVTMTPPGASAETLVAIDDWDYNWQETYVFQQPIQVKAGTRFDVEAFYDNSEKNPNNPSTPPRAVHFGEQTTDEMCFVFLGVTSDTPGRIRPLFQAPKKDEAKATKAAAR